MDEHGAGGSRLSRREAWTVTALALLALSLWLRQAPLALLSAGLLAAAASVSLWQRYALARLTYIRTVGERRAFFGEDVPLTIEITNHKLLPLPWLEVDDALPAGLPVDGASIVNEPGRLVLRQLLAMAPYERVRLHYRLHCGARGAHVVGPVRLRTGDPFGFAGREMVLPIYDRLLVYPRVVPVAQLGLPARHPFGDRPDPRRLFQDPARVVGVRPYASGDSPRYIHWKASARSQALQTRVFEPTASHTLMLYVNLASFEGYWWASLNRDLLELCIVVAASVAAWGVEQGYQVGVTTNGAAAGGADELAVPPASDPQQLVRVLEALARISVFARTPLEAMLARDRTRLPWGTTVVAITAVLPEPVRRALLSFASAGHTAAALVAGNDRSVDQIPGLVTYRVPADAPWWQLDVVAATRRER